MVEHVRALQNEKMDLDVAVDRTIDEMPGDFLIRNFLVGNRAEVKLMFLTEYNEEKMLEMEGKEKFDEGYSQGISQGISQGKFDMLVTLLKEKTITFTKAVEKSGVSANEFTRITGIKP